MNHIASIKTTCGELFTDNDQRALATLIYLRFGRDASAATEAWRRLLQNNCDEHQFMAMVVANAPADRADPPLALAVERFRRSSV